MIRSVGWAVVTVRTVLQENLEERLEEGKKLWGDGLQVPFPRPGLVSEGGDYYQMVVEPEQVGRLACAVFARESSPAPGSGNQVIHQAHRVTIRFLDTVTGKVDTGKVEELTRRLERYEAAVKDLFQWRKTRLQTLDVPAGIAAGVTWIISRFPNEPGGVKTVEIDLSVRIHEDKGD